MDILHVKEQVRKAIRAYKRKKAERLSAPGLRRLSSEQRRIWTTIIKNMLIGIQREDKLQRARMVRYYASSTLPKAASVLDSCLCVASASKEVGRGAFGRAYVVESATSPNHQRTCTPVSKPARYKYAVKVENISRQEETRWMRGDVTERFIKSIAIGKLAGDIGTGPRIHDGYVCEHKGRLYGITIMDYIDGQTLREFMHNKDTLDKDRKHVHRVVQRRIMKMSAHGIVHNDLHDNNVIVYKKKSGRYDVKIIDYGLAAMLVNENNRLLNNDYEKRQEQDKEIARMLKYTLSYLVTKGVLAATSKGNENATDDESEEEKDSAATSS